MSCPQYAVVLLFITDTVVNTYPLVRVFQAHDLVCKGVVGSTEILAGVHVPMVLQCMLPGRQPTCIVASRILATCSSRSRARMPPDSRKLVGVLALLLGDEVPRFGVRHPGYGMYTSR